VRHLVALSAQVADEGDVGRISCPMTIRTFVLYRIFATARPAGSSFLASWFWSMLEQKQRIQPLDGLGYRPIAVVGSKEEFLEWIGEAVRDKTIEIPG